LAIGLQKLAIVGEVRHRKRVRMRGVRATIVLEGERADAQPKLPERLFGGSRRPEEQTHDRGSDDHRAAAAGLGRGSHQPLVMWSDAKLRLLVARRRAA